jgi:predicted AlkP superfamily phosphohydrolase/phosphomutase
MFNFRKKKSSKLLVIGLDCAPPELVFQQWRNELPNFNQLISRGTYGNLRSCTPCITVPAWSVMTSSKDPGVLGIYGFRNRADYSYDRMTIATGASVKEPRVWEILGQAGKKVVTIGVPGTYPPRPVNGSQIACFLTPQTVSTDDNGNKITKTFTYPPELSVQVNAWAGGEYVVDVKQFRTDDKDFLLKQIYDMSRQHFTVVREMLKYQPWDFFMFVEMGTDRIHHGFWKFIDKTHSKYEPGNPYEDSIRDYYRYLDGEIGELLKLIDDETAVMVVSDHGAKKMDGGICINDWMTRTGWLALADDRPTRLTPMEKVEIDWGQTKAWGEGGYYARVFMNVQGREPQGIIPPSEYEKTRDELAEAIKNIRGPNGVDIGTEVFKPQRIYRKVNGVAPDLIVYFGNLLWRSVGSLGHPEVWTFENDTGPDDANHAQQGILIYYDPNRKLGGRELSGVEIMDFAPTVLQHFGLPIPADMQGRTIQLEGKK